FIYCTALPTPAQRGAVLQGLPDGVRDGRVRVFDGKRWGSGDFALLNGVETWLMYFTVEDAMAEVDAVLSGKQPDKLDNYYYPVGRLGMLSNITVLFDRSGFLGGLKQRLAHYPPELAQMLTDHHLNALTDTEDLERAAARQDVLFYHFALDLALDHWLQALFAMNHTYFPSRKRTLQYTQGFTRKPARLEQRLTQLLALGGAGDTVPASYAILQSLIAELSALAQARPQHKGEIG
ncbi:MAG: DUF4037 domain-containing protein, partial [Firmicutes bacterium]|nr:DUF4037 domain-containing protein [Bacillota bacterium]